MARHLTIDYALTGARRGYTYSTPTDGIDAATLKTVWRASMPRGQGWGEPLFVGARSLKAFAVESGEIALCEVVVTDLVDEAGRHGIRRASIDLLKTAEYEAALKGRLAALPADLVANAEQKLASREWALLFRKRRDQQPPLSIVKPQTILAYPYRSADGWRFIEACLLLLVTRTSLLANLIEVSPAINPFADRALSFTTLALDPREESRLVAIPAAKVSGFPDLPIIQL